MNLQILKSFNSLLFSMGVFIHIIYFAIDSPGA